VRSQSPSDPPAPPKRARGTFSFDWLPWKIIDRLLLPTIFFLTAFVFALTLRQLLMTHRSVEIQAVTQEQAVFVKSKMESELRARILPLEGLAGHWSARGQSENPENTSEMESDAELVMSAYPAYQSMEWLDPEFHVRWVKTPPGAKEPDPDTVVSSDASEVAALRTAKTRRSATVSRPVTLRKGDRGLLVSVPVYSKQELRGFLVGAFRYNELIPSIIQDVAQGYSIAVYDDDERIYSVGADLKPQDADLLQTTNVRFQQLAWRVQIWPKPATISYALSILPQAAFIVGILMAALIAFAVYLAETARLHARGVEATHKKLHKEIAGREQAEQALREAQKMEAVGQLAGGVAHDFNNLLMVIRGHAVLSLNRNGYDAAVRRELNEILHVTDRASALTRRLLAFSRKQVLQLRVTDLNALVSQAKELLPPVLGKDIDLFIDLDPHLGRVKADSAQMEQVIMNLVLNARDAMPEGGELTIQTANVDLDEEWVRAHPGASPGPHVMLAVRDTGTGMDQETLSHIFEPFFTTKDRTKGTGLGLATVYGTVRQCGGFMRVPTKIGEGTTFQIYLARVEEALEPMEAPETAPQLQQGAETILVVEDDNAVRRMTREFLKIKGYTVIEARSAAAAIQIFESKTQSIDLVLTDVLMPGMKGRELVERLGQISADLKVLYMSAYTEDAAINIGVLNPGTEFIEKPFSPDELASKVREVLSGGRDKPHSSLERSIAKGSGSA